LEGRCERFLVLSRAELEVKPAVQDDPFDEPRDDGMSDTSKNLVEGDNGDVSIGGDEGNEHGRITAFEVIPNTQATAATAANSTTAVSTGDAGRFGVAMSQVTPKLLTQQWTPLAWNQAYSQLSQLTHT
jgi:hypothetical protein